MSLAFVAALQEMKARQTELEKRIQELETLVKSMQDKRKTLTLPNKNA